jgi:methylmalonyl-CoA mutase cobalamin-binding domain/chain
MAERLIEALAELQEEEAISEVEALRKKGTPPLEIIQMLQEGMRIIGDRFERQEYFLSEMILAAEIFRQAVGLMGEDFACQAEPQFGTMVMGTIYGDIHDIGKNIVATVLSCNGFRVVDLGVDVPAEKFIEAVKENDARLVGISCLLTTAFENIKRAVERFGEEGLRDRVKILVGGGPVDQMVCAYVGADGFGKNAQEAVNLAKSLSGRD